MDAPGSQTRSSDGSRVSRFPPIRDAQAVFRFGLAALDEEPDNDIIAWFRHAAQRQSNNPGIRQILALMLRDAGQQAEAMREFDVAARLAPQDFRIALGRAHARFEAGLDAEEHYRAALALASDPREVIPGLTAALCASGQHNVALQEIDTLLRINPEWLDGHWLAARVSLIAGAAAEPLSTVNRALARHPRHIGLLRLRTAILMANEQFDGALASARAALELSANDAGMRFDAAVCLSENWQLADADRFFDSLPTLDHPATTVHLVRHMLRRQKAEMIEPVIARFSANDLNCILQPYLSLALRCLGDSRWQDLDKPDETVGVYNVASQLPSFARLAELLRKIHRNGDAPLDQSLRGGTQTEGSLLSRIEPEIVSLRFVLEQTVKHHAKLVLQQTDGYPGIYVSNTPRFAGSWSVRLQCGGHHISHTHPDGWLSSALYICLPEEMGQDNAGCLTFGAPPPNLGLKLTPLRVIKPGRGQLVLFPSTLWHGTVPFQSGERLTIAFDVARPRSTGRNFVARS